MARGQRSRQSVFLPAALDPDSIRGERHFDVDDQCLQLHFALHHEPGFTGGLEHQFCPASRHRRAERDYQSYLGPTAVLPSGPVIKSNPYEIPFSKLARFLSRLYRATMNASESQFCLTPIASMNLRAAKSNFLAVARWQLACLSVLLAVVTPAVDRAKLRLSTVKPGTERVQLINNGDFQFQGPLTNGA